MGSGEGPRVHGQQRAPLHAHLGVSETGTRRDQGWAIGGATDLVLCCDLLFMASDAHIGYAPSRIYGTPTTMLWVYRLGLEHAKQFLLTGRAIDAATAYRIGLVSHVVEPDELSRSSKPKRCASGTFRRISSRSNKLLINQAFENDGAAHHAVLGTFFDGVTRHTEEAYRGWSRSTRKVSPGDPRRDAPWQDYGRRREKHRKKPKEK